MTQRELRDRHSTPIDDIVSYRLGKSNSCFSSGNEPTKTDMELAYEKGSSTGTAAATQSEVDSPTDTASDISISDISGKSNSNFEGNSDNEVSRSRQSRKGSEDLTDA